MNTTNNFPPGTFETSENSQEASDLDVTSSSSVSSLINHNQDLASRLNVAVGRNIELEKTIARFKKAYAQYEERFQSAKDQVSIHKEKEKFLQNESNTLKQKIQSIKAHLNQERKEFEKEKEELTVEVQASKPMVAEYKRLKNLIEDEYLPERTFLQQSLVERDKNINDLEEERSSLLKKLGEASEHIQTIAKEFKEEISKKEISLTSDINALKTKLDDVQSENIVLNDRNRTLRKEQIEKTELLNRIEEIKKEKEMNIYQGKEEKDDLLLQLSKLKQENDRVKIENHSLKKQWAATQSEFRAYKNKNTSTNDEVTSLRALWQEKTNEFTQVGLKNESLEKEISTLEEKLNLAAGMHTDTKQRLEFFFSQLENIKTKQGEADLKATEAMEKAFKKAIEPFKDFDYNL